MSCLVIRPRCCCRQNSERESRKSLSIRKYYKIGIFTWLSQPLHLATINERLYLESPMSELHCPACGGSKIRLAARKSLSDVLLSGLTIYPFRCQLCADRFRTFLGRRTPNPRRSFERIEVSFPVWFRPRRSKYPDEPGQEGVIEDLSIRGCRIRSTTPVAVGSRLELEFQNSNDSFPITIEEAVVRSSANGASGLRFTRLGRNDERRIRQLIDVWLQELLPSSRER
jgi:hypothetical protein